MNITENMSLLEKLTILSDAAKYDVACTSSGVDRKGNYHGMGNSIAPGICHTFSADGRCISLLKILFTNECIFRCAYCQNNCNNDVPRASFTPDEVCTLTMEFYRRNYIEGLFLSSGILISPNYTMELIYQTLYQLRVRHHFNGYIHVKAIPGADPVLIEKVGFLADRMSINLELPTADGLKALAPNKSRKTILKPMRLIQNGIMENQNELMVYHKTPKFVPAVPKHPDDYRCHPRKRLSDYEGSRRLIPEFPVETSLLLSLCQCKSQFQSANPSRWSAPSAGTPPVSGRLAASLLWFFCRRAIKRRPSGF